MIVLLVGPRCLSSLNRMFTYRMIVHMLLHLLGISRTNPLSGQATKIFMVCISYFLPATQGQR
jgi:hypothetical protein